MIKLVSSVPLDDGQRARLTEIAPDLTIVASEAFLSEDFGGLIESDSDIVYGFRMPGDLMNRAPDLKWVQLLGAGCEHLHDHAVMQTDVHITTASGIHATPIAEYVMGVILGHYRWLPQAMRSQLERRWRTQAEFARGSRELRRRTIGIVGYGSIGREVARLAQPFGVRILAMKRDPSRREEVGYAIEGLGDPDGSIPEKIYGPGELNELLAESDVVVLAVPVTDDTTRMIGAAELAAMKPGSFLVNIARGSVIDEAALVEALRNGPMGGAALDVFDHEPLPEDSPLWDLENAIITPHISGASRPHLRRVFELLVENLGRFTRDKPLLNAVSRETGY